MVTDERLMNIIQEIRKNEWSNKPVCEHEGWEGYRRPNFNLKKYLKATPEIRAEVGEEQNGNR